MNPSAMKPSAINAGTNDTPPAADHAPRREGVWTLASALSIGVWLVTLAVGGLAGFRLGLQAGSPLVAMLAALSGALFCSILADAVIRRLRARR